MININQVIVAGNVVKDAELRYTKNNKPVTTFRVATNKYGPDWQPSTSHRRLIEVSMDGVR